MALGLKGRVAVATGTTHVMEEEPQSILANERYQLALCVIKQGVLEKTVVKLWEKGVKVYAEKVDVTNLEETDAFISNTAKEFGSIDTLVNNAGTGTMSDPMELPEEVIHRN